MGMVEGKVAADVAEPCALNMKNDQMGFEEGQEGKLQVQKAYFQHEIAGWVVELVGLYMDVETYRS